MTSTAERRKHGACMLRFRESCASRKLRKNKCGGSYCVIQRYVTRCVYSLCKVTSISEAVGRRWRSCQATVPPLENCAETYPLIQSYHHQQQEDHSAMDAEAAPDIAGPAFSITHGSNLVRLQQSSLSASDLSMEFDSGVDPETGERAQV